MNLFCALFVFCVICLICLDASNIREGKVTGGREAEPHSNPYVVSLQSRFAWRRYRICSGSILSERWILSAGHCVTDSFARWLAMDAIIGAHNLGYIYSSQIYPISHRIAHPMYRGGVGPYDIAMMRTSRDIQFSREAQPISLPIVPPRDETTRDNNLLITGWGALQSTWFYTVLPNKLQEARVSYLPHRDCYRAVDKLKEYYEPNPLKRIHNLCTGPIHEGIAGCTGDSGGPLVQYIPMLASVTEPSSSTTGKEETSSLPSSSMSPTPMSTDRTTTTTSSTTSSSSMSPTPISTDRTTTTTSSTTSSSSMSPTPMSTDRTSTTTTTTSSPIPVSTDRTSSTSEYPMSTTSISTDISSTMSSATVSPLITDGVSEQNVLSTLPGEDATIWTGIDETTLDPFVTLPIVSRVGRDEDTIDLRYSFHNQRADTVPTVIGVISWGVVPCGKKGAPTVYSNVSNYMDFIDKYLTSTYY